MGLETPRSGEAPGRGRPVLGHTHKRPLAGHTPLPNSKTRRPDASPDRRPAHRSNTAPPPAPPSPPATGLCETPEDRRLERLAIEMYNRRRTGERADRYRIDSTETTAPHDFEIVSRQYGKHVAAVEVKCRLPYSMDFLASKGLIYCRDKVEPSCRVLDRDMKVVILAACKDGWLVYDFQDAIMKPSEKKVGRTDRGRPRDYKHEILLFEPSARLPYTETERDAWARAGVEVTAHWVRRTASR